MSQKKERKMQKSDTVLGTQTGRIGAAPPTPPATEACNTRGPDYWEGWRACDEKRREREKEMADDKRSEETRANERVYVELGDATVTFRDGLGRVIKRIGQDYSVNTDRRLQFCWTDVLAEIMALRRCSHFSVGVSEHLHLTITQKLDSYVKQYVEKGLASYELRREP